MSDRGAARCKRGRRREPLLGPRQPDKVLREALLVCMRHGCGLVMHDSRIVADWQAVLLLLLLARPPAQLRQVGGVLPKADRARQQPRGGPSRPSHAFICIEEPGHHGAADAPWLVAKERANR